MEHISYSNFRKHLARSLDRVSIDHTPMMITRQSGEPAVVMSLEDFRSYEETFHLLSSPANAERLSSAIVSLDAGNGIERDIIEE